LGAEEREEAIEKKAKELEMRGYRNSNADHLYAKV
jgi:hypothetical protein